MSTVRYFDPPTAFGPYRAVYFGAPMESGAFPFRTEDGKWGLASADRDILCPPAYDALSPMPDREKQYLLCCLGSQWGLIDAQGKERLACKWDEILSVFDHLMAVRQGDYWGFARMELGRFNPVTPIVYGDWNASETKDGIGAIIVWQCSQWGCMGEGGSGMTLWRAGMLDGMGRVLARPQWKRHEIHPGGSTYGERKLWYLQNVRVDTQEDEHIMLVEENCLTPQLKEGTYR